MIIDAHAHTMAEVRGQTGQGSTHSLTYGKVQWGKNQTIRLLPPLSASTTSFPPDLLLENMDWAGVDKAVLLQGSFYGEANEYVWQAVQKWPDRFVGAAYIDPRAPDVRDTFRKITEEFGFQIIKLELSEPTGFVGLYPDLQLDEERLAWLWIEAERRNMVITLDLGAVGSRSYQTQSVETLLERHPQLKFVIAHLAQPPLSQSHNQELDQMWQDQILLARYPNLWFDLSALPAYASEDYPYPLAQKYIQRAVELVGVEKIMWGTDAPGLLSHAIYPQLLNFVARHCDFLSDNEVRQILGGNAARVYGDP